MTTMLYTSSGNVLPVERITESLKKSHFTSRRQWYRPICLNRDIAWKLLLNVFEYILFLSITRNRCRTIPNLYMMTSWKNTGINDKPFHRRCGNIILNNFVWRLRYRHNNWSVYSLLPLGYVSFILTWLILFVPIVLTTLSNEKI